MIQKDSLNSLPRAKTSNDFHSRTASTSSVSSFLTKKDTIMSSSYESLEISSPNLISEPKNIRRKRIKVYNLRRNRITVIHSSSQEYPESLKKRVKIIKNTNPSVCSATKVFYKCTNQVIEIRENSDR